MTKKIIKKTREVITPIVDTAKLVRQNIPVRGNKGSAKNDPELGKSCLTNFGKLAELFMA